MVSSVLDTLIYIEEVDDVVLQDLSLFDLPQVGREHTYSVIPAEREFNLIGSLACSLSCLVRLKC
jgi:hypothetical protein